MKTIRELIRDLYGDLEPMGKLMLALGITVLVAATLMSLDFGWSVSLKHAAFLGALSVVVAFMPDIAFDQWQRGRKFASVFIGVLCIPALVIEFGSHAGYTAGLRGSNIAEAKIQNTKYDDTREQVVDHKANLAMWREQLAKLQSENAWAATVKADGMRSELATLRERIDDERAGNRGRKAGCGKECERLQNAANDLEKRIAIAEQASDLTKRIEATQRLVDKAREGSAATEYKNSSVDHQNQFFKHAVAVFGFGATKAPSIVDERVEQTINLAMAGAATGLPALCLAMAGLYRRNRKEHTPIATAMAQQQQTAHALVAEPVPPVEHRFAPPPARPQRYNIQKLTVHDLLHGPAQAA